jgi:hypothetical protein
MARKDGHQRRFAPPWAKAASRTHCPYQTVASSQRDGARRKAVLKASDNRSRFTVPHGVSRGLFQRSGQMPHPLGKQVCANAPDWIRTNDLRFRSRAGDSAAVCGVGFHADFAGSDSAEIGSTPCGTVPHFVPQTLPNYDLEVLCPRPVLGVDRSSGPVDLRVVSKVSPRRAAG